MRRIVFDKKEIIFYRVTTSCDINLDGEPKNFAKPKSAIFKTPRLSINKLFGFRS